MATHYCPDCGAFSYHGSGVASWAFPCPSCGAVHPQAPHPPEPATTAAPAPEAAAAVDVEGDVDQVDTAPAGPVHVGGGWYELPDGRRIRGREAAFEAAST